MDETISLMPIGHIENAFDKRAAPDVIRAEVSRVIIDPDLEDGLLGLEAGGQVMVVYYFHRSRGYELRQHRRGDPLEPELGVFALRSPDRPNPIGVTVVDVLAIEGCVLTVRGLDALNGSPLLDIKPA
jgi:tRNA-Thr(GGU) m(6)t(6)A37 methyltransferase TsaA